MSHARVSFVLSLCLSVFVAGCGKNNSSLDPAAENVALQSSDKTSDDLPDPSHWRGSMPFADAEVFFEFNSTDNDLGFQVFLDGVGWKRVQILGPDYRRVLDIKAKGSLKHLGITELFFESAEPSPGEVLALFEPGEYLFLGRSAEGKRLYGKGELSHELLPPPVFTPSGGVTVAPEDITVEWNEVPGVECYQLIVSNEDNGANLQVDLPAEATSLTLPDEFVEGDSEYKVEVLAIAENGNKTITEGFFYTGPEALARR